MPPGETLSPLRESLPSRPPVTYYAALDFCRSSATLQTKKRNEEKGTGTFIIKQFSCSRLRSGHHKKDVALLRWLMENDHVAKKVVEEYLPGILEEI